MTALRAMERFDVAPLFAPLHRELLQLLRSLSDEAWERPTIAGWWRVRDVAAHLLDGILRKLSAHRDGHLLRSGEPPRTYDDVVSLINSLNATGVSYGERLSTRLIADLLEVAGTSLSDFVATLDPAAPALFPVTWAGETESQNWMDTGREYTEHWHHQMQIREAADAPLLLLEDRWYEPLLSFSVRALPRTYANVTAAEGTSINLHIDERPWAWCLLREAEGWHLYNGSVAEPSASVRIPLNDAWRLFYNALDASTAESSLHIEGNRELGLHLVAARSVMV